MKYFLVIFIGLMGVAGAKTQQGNFLLTANNSAISGGPNQHTLNIELSNPEIKFESEEGGDSAPVTPKKFVSQWQNGIFSETPPNAMLICGDGSKKEARLRVVKADLNGQNSITLQAEPYHPDAFQKDGKIISAAEFVQSANNDAGTVLFVDSSPWDTWRG